MSNSKLPINLSNCKLCNRKYKKRGPHSLYCKECSSDVRLVSLKRRTKPKIYPSFKFPAAERERMILSMISVIKSALVDANKETSVTNIREMARMALSHPDIKWPIKKQIILTDIVKGTQIYFLKSNP